MVLRVVKRPTPAVHKTVVVRLKPYAPLSDVVRDVAVISQLIDRALAAKLPTPPSASQPASRSPAMQSVVHKLFTATPATPVGQSTPAEGASPAVRTPARFGNQAPAAKAEISYTAQLVYATVGACALFRDKVSGSNVLFSHKFIFQNRGSCFYNRELRACVPFPSRSRPIPPCSFMQRRGCVSGSYVVRDGPHPGEDEEAREGE